MYQEATKELDRMEQEILVSFISVFIKLLLKYEIVTLKSL